jgi:hypothetical protein
MQKSSVVPRRFDPMYLAEAIKQSSTRGAFAAFWLDIAARFYRFLNNLPERFDDVDPEVFKRVPVPV